MKNIFQNILNICILILLFSACELDETPNQPISTFMKSIGDIGSEAAHGVIEIPNTQEYILVGHGGIDCSNGFIVKIDDKGNIIQENNGFGTAATSTTDVFLDASLSSDGSVLAVGWSADAASDCNWFLSADLCPDGSNPDSLVQKTNPDGKIFFAKVPPSLALNDITTYSKEINDPCNQSRWDAGYGITEVAGTFIITGAWGVSPALIKVSSNDISTTSQQIPFGGQGGVWVGEAKAAFENESGGVIFTGKGVDTNGTIKALFAEMNAVSSNDIVAKYATHPLKNHAEGQAIVQTKDRGYILTGLAFDTPDNSNFSGLFSQDVALYLGFYDANGENINNKLWTPPNNAVSGGMDIIAFEDNYMITGFTFENGVRELLLLCIDDEGNEIWHESYQMGENEYQNGYEVIATSDGGILSVGETSVSSNAQNTDFFIVKTNRVGELFQ